MSEANEQEMTDFVAQATEAVRRQRRQATPVIPSVSMFLDRHGVTDLRTATFQQRRAMAHSLRGIQDELRAVLCKTEWRRSKTEKDAARKWLRLDKTFNPANYQREPDINNWLTAGA